MYNNSTTKIIRGDSATPDTKDDKSDKNKKQDPLAPIKEWIDYNYDFVMDENEVLYYRAKDSIAWSRYNILIPFRGKVAGSGNNQLVFSRE